MTAALAVAVVLGEWLAQGPALAEPSAQGAPSLEISEISMDSLLAPNFTVDDLLKYRSQAASKRALTVRETPGIVTIVTEEEIRNSGARELVDLLQMVPGLNIAIESVDTPSIAVRGLFAHEGKILLLIDGQEMNEVVFSNLTLGNHYPIDQIAQIEVLRGPGSAMYGDIAELSVIKITTKGAAGTLDGVELISRAGRLRTNFGHLGLTLTGARKLSNGLKLSASAFVGGGSRSDRARTDAFGVTYDLADGSATRPLNLNLGASYKSLDLRFIYDRFESTTRDNFAFTAPAPFTNRFRAYRATLRYTAQLTPSFRIVPELQYVDDRPWDMVSILQQPAPMNPALGGSWLAIDVAARRIAGKVAASWAIRDWVSLDGGIDSKLDHAEGYIFASSNTFSESAASLALYSEVTAQHTLANVTVGGRWEHHQLFGSALVPRAALTKVLDPFHLKLIASDAFRVPTIGDRRTGATPAQLKPEKARIYELEAGVRLGQQQLLTANLYHQTITDPVVFLTDTASYDNYKRTGSRGLEIEHRLRAPSGYLTTNYSYYNSSGLNQLEKFAVPGKPGSLVGISNHKVTTNAHLKLPGGLSFNPSVIWLGPCKAYDYAPTAPPDPASGMQYALRDMKATWLANVNIRKDDLWIDGLGASFAVFNAFDADYRYPMPYAGGATPLPTSGREFLFSLSYRLDVSPASKGM